MDYNLKRKVGLFGSGGTELTLKVVQPTLTARAGLVVTAFVLAIYFALSAATESALRTSAAISSGVTDAVSAIESRGIVIRDSLARTLAPQSVSRTQTGARGSTSRARSTSTSLAAPTESARVVEEPSAALTIAESLSVLPVIGQGQLARVLDAAATEKSTQTTRSSLPKVSTRTSSKTKASVSSGVKIVAPKARGHDHGSSNERAGSGSSNGGGKPS